MTDDEVTEEIKPPYMPFTTFWTFLTELGNKPLPPQIDRSMMSAKSGTDQASIFNALKFFGLINAINAVQPGLTAFTAADEAGRKRSLESMMRQQYPSQIEVSEHNGTEKLLLDSFESAFGYTGDTRRKAMTFFLHGARFAGIDLSAHFPVTRMGSGRPANGRPKRTVKNKVQNPGGTSKAAGGVTDSGQKGEPVHVALGDAGSVDVLVNVRWLELPDETFTSLRRIVGELRALGAEPQDEETEEDGV
jgi:hypothetical protein